MNFKMIKLRTELVFYSIIQLAVEKPKENKYYEVLDLRYISLNPCTRSCRPTRAQGTHGQPRWFPAWWSSTTAPGSPRR